MSQSRRAPAGAPGRLWSGKAEGGLWLCGRVARSLEWKGQGLAVQSEGERYGLPVRQDEIGRVHEPRREGRKPIAARGRKGSAPCVRLVVTLENREVEMGSGAHVGDVCEDFSPCYHRADFVAGPRPDVPVLGDHDPIRSFVADEDSAPEGRVDDVADAHAVSCSHHRLTVRGDVDSGVGPYRAGRAALPQDGPGAVAPLAAESKAVWCPRRQWELKIVDWLGRGSNCGR